MAGALRRPPKGGDLLEGTDQGRTIGLGPGPHQGHQPLAPLGIREPQQQHRLQGQSGGGRRGQQAPLQELGENRFAAALQGPIQAAQHGEAPLLQPGRVAAAPPALAIAGQGAEPAGLQPAGAEPGGAHLQGRRTLRLQAQPQGRRRRT